MTDKYDSPISSGWRGHKNGHVAKSKSSQVNVETLGVSLDRQLAHDLCNVLYDQHLVELKRIGHLSDSQVRRLSNLGAAIGCLIDHPTANNGGREVVK